MSVISTSKGEATDAVMIVVSCFATLGIICSVVSTAIFCTHCRGKVKRFFGFGKQENAGIGNSVVQGNADAVKKAMEKIDGPPVNMTGYEKWSGQKPMPLFAQPLDPTNDTMYGVVVDFKSGNGSQREKKECATSPSFHLQTVNIPSKEKASTISDLGRNVVGDGVDVLKSDMAPERKEAVVRLIKQFLIGKVGGDQTFLIKMEIAYGGRWILFGGTDLDGSFPYTPGSLIVVQAGNTKFFVFQT